ncbi:type I polyketide synthase [Acaryochloris marina]|uniref:Phenolphthiocerol/phthiocerol polyketide synthase subunit E n=1 Tax=Acaryochloris marina (strain MBIC 11017) TaxID=329726 RepID=A8ZKN3_ACAM1|nr:type I polyketide synthase [Acaryochloris marina]ABW31351.1 polyketide synthase type I, putative [Acaryochloris marina MBIC11017]
MNGLEIAIIGLSGRFPGAQTIDEFWQNLKQGVESVSFLSDEELLASGIDADTLSDPNYVKANAILSDADAFDAQFFGISPKEAELLDPQQRLFLEQSWTAISHAGYDPATYDGVIGVYAGVDTSTYLVNNLCPTYGGIADLQMFLGNAVDYLATRVAYKLNLNGPAITVQTACSTSLVAVHLACQSILNGECDMALAGGVSITVPQITGYTYQESGIASPDGHCRAFDAQAQGTLFGSGVGIVLLKRLSDVIADGDTIHAVIKGSAVNNDGALKAGYTAPSPEGQTTVISEAQAIAGIHPETITYIEAHGTGTALGDPIELAALTQVFRRQTNKTGFCAIGSVKTNVGHLSVAAGITGLIKTVLSLKHRQIPPSLHFQQPNPQIDFASSPFYVNTALADWPTGNTPRRAGVSSFGMGGTNVHVVLEETPPAIAAAPSRPWQLLKLSAKTPSALEQATAELINQLNQTPELNLADVAYTLQVGRPGFSERRMLVCQTLDQAVQDLENGTFASASSVDDRAAQRPIVFMFSGQGTQYVNMARELYDCEPTFRQWIDRGSDLLKPHLGLDLRHILYPNSAQTEDAAQQLQQTAVTQPALFLLEYALAQLWQDWGVAPTAMMGHSIGEYVAATLAGVFSFEAALTLVAARGALMQSLPAGQMLSLPLSEAEVQPLLGSGLSLAVINGAAACVVSGETDAVTDLQEKLAAQGVEGRLLHTSHAFHSAMMAPILDRFRQRVQQVSPNPPQIPFVSNVTGTWITPQEATDPAYWANHLRQTVRFADGLQTLMHDAAPILLEVGPGRTLTTLAKRHPSRPADTVILSSVRHPQDASSDAAFLLNTLGHLWLSGVLVNGAEFYRHESRRRIPLPTYPFEPQRYWIDPPRHSAHRALTALSDAGSNNGTSKTFVTQKSEIADWFYLPAWKPSVAPQAQFDPLATTCDLVLIHDQDREVGGFVNDLIQHLEQQNPNLIFVQPSTAFAQLNDRFYTVNPQSSDDYQTLIQTLVSQHKRLQKIVHLWTLSTSEKPNGNFASDYLASDPELVQRCQFSGFYSLLFLAQALAKQTEPDANSDGIQITVISNYLQSVTGNDPLAPEKSLLLGPIRVIPQEYPTIHCRSIDINLPSPNRWQAERLTGQLLHDICCPITEPIIAYRGHQRYVQAVEKIRLDEPSKEDFEVRSHLRQNGVYLITGGLGHIGLTLARYLAESMQAKLILMGRSTLPEKGEWHTWLSTHAASDRISRKIRQIQALEALGAEVLVVSADVSNEAELRSAISQAESQFGAINGVIHGAGLVGAETFRAISQLDLVTCEQQFQPKVYGLLVLEKVLNDKPLDFCLLLSSLSSVLGGLGHASYAAANLFMDALTHYHNQTHSSPWISINWDAWNQDSDTEKMAFFGSSLAQFSIEPDEGIRALQQILLHPEQSQVIVSTADLSARIDQWIRPKAIGKKLALESSHSHERPTLSTDYIPPEHKAEKILADIFQQVLGVKPIGIYDSFFDLGGDSMIGIQLISKIRSHFQIELSIQHLFEAPCIADLAFNIEALLIEDILVEPLGTESR